MDKLDVSVKYFNKANELVLKYHDIVISEQGIMSRIAFYKENGLPKPNYNKNNDKSYRTYIYEIESSINNCFKKGVLDVSILDRVVNLIEMIIGFSEHAIYKNEFKLAMYFYKLSMLYADLSCKDKAYNMLLKAVRVADNDDNIVELYAVIYTDICSYVPDIKSKINYSQKAVEIYEALRKAGKEYSLNSYAVLLHNLAKIYKENRDTESAIAYIKKAITLWEELLEINDYENVKTQVENARIEALALTASATLKQQNTATNVVNKVINKWKSWFLAHLR